VLVYLGAVLVLGLPVMIAELVIGRHTERDPVGAFKTMFGKSHLVLVGYMGVLAGFLILSFYSVVGGWTIGYMVEGIVGALNALQTPAAAQQVFQRWTADPAFSIGYHFYLWLPVSISSWAG